MDYIKLVAGLVLLTISGDYLVKGGVSIATKFKISSLVIGMTVIAFGTSAPELLVSLQAALKNSQDIAVGNVVGSNIANIALILGITSIIYPLAVNKNTIRYDWPVMMIVTLLFTWAAWDGFISRPEGIIGFSLLICYTVWQIVNSRRNHVADEESDEKIYPLGIAITFVVLSCAGLAYGANLLIDGASNIALSWGVSQRVIGVTIVAFGTSLPELAASVSAAIKKETDIAIGNIIGSNLFNILSVIGLTSIIKPINLNWITFRPDFILMIIIALLLFILIIPVKYIFNKRSERFSIETFFSKWKLGRIGGIVLLLIYIYYIYTLLNKS